MTSKVFPNDAPSPSKPFFQADVANRPLRFRDFNELRQWIDREYAAWEWFIALGEDVLGPQLFQIRNHHRSGLRAVRSKLEQWESAESDEGKRQSFYEAFVAYFGSPDTFFSDHPAVKIAIQIAQKLNAQAGAGAFAYLLGKSCPTNFDTLRGMIEAAAINSGAQGGSRDVISKTINELTADAKTDRSRRSEEWQQLISEISNFMHESVRSAEKIDEQAKNSVATADREVQAAIASLQATQKTYTEHMHLAASVDYWNTRANQFRTATENSSRRLIAFVIVAATILIISLLVLAYFAGTSTDGLSQAKATLIYVKFGVIGVLLTTLAFLAGRLLLRIFLSDRHLRTDAEERVTMIKTYLALTNEGKVEPTDRTLVLTPVFKSASDGIVRDEGLDPSLVGLIAKGIEKLK